MPGDRVLVNKLAYGYRIPFTDWLIAQGKPALSGEVVILPSPEDGTLLIKRVVATAGDQIMVRDGGVTINGRPAALPGDPATEVFGARRVSLNLALGSGPAFGPIVIDSGYVLVIGDARGKSRDGRDFGLAPVGSLRGRAIAVFMRSGEGLVWKAL